MKQLLCLLISGLLCLLLSGCPARPVADQSFGTGPGYTVTDDTGYTMVLPAKPQRIVSLAYSVDELLVDLVATERILAFSRWADDRGITFITSDQAAAVANRAVPYAESLIALRPDLIIAAAGTMRPEAVQTLRDTGIAVFISQSPKNLPAVKTRIKTVAAAVGEEDKGQILIAQMEQRLQRLEATLAPVTADKRKCAMAFDFTGVIGNRHNLLADIFNYAHVRNGAARAGAGSIEQGENRLSKEQIIAVNPDIFLLPTWNFDGRSDIEAYRRQIMTDPALQQVAAVRNNQVKLIPDRYRYVGSHHVVESVVILATAVYPELFYKEGHHAEAMQTK
ncbi:ABC transporter substrate-binding protein [Sporomusa termitida]|uniref:Putative ABC transporter PGF-CTERM-modified substrate-binding protein n=1 Tax=Sporomusa termitida TaxID=2377 RepID=A0A517DNY8_9FIRM|nr:ABC transporter substrate-binding protein [Sporomusa termitida]QDR79080.1 putative ABC transporter PGF-CTERM-modified substrate-binding protein [Sporomusa termitida]